MKLTISIVIPIYNAERFLEETLSSIAMQTYTDWECICVNDGSTDNSGRIIDAWVVKDKRYKRIDIPNSGNADIPISKGIDSSGAEWCCYMGHDDVLEPKFLQKIVSRQQDTQADIVCGRLIGCEHELQGELYRVPWHDFDMSQLLTGKEACAKTIGDWQISCNGMLFRKELYENVTHGKDMNSDEFTARQILYKANRVAFVDAHYIYRQHATSISRAVSPRYFQRIYVDKQVEDFVYESFDEQEIKKRALSTRFFNLVHLAADSVKYRKCFTDSQSQKIKEGIKANISTLRREELKTDLPFHASLFSSNYYLFMWMSLVYVAIQHLEHKKYEYK